MIIFVDRRSYFSYRQIYIYINMKYISTVILFLGFSSFAFTQETFSKIIGFDETIADLGVHLRLLDDQILVYSLHDV